MNTVHRFALATGFAVLAGLVSAVTAPALPEQVVTNWNAAGDPSGTMPKAQALWLLPVVLVGLLVVFAVVPRIDPLQDNLDAFRPYYDWLVVLLSAYLFVVHAGLVAFNLGYEFDFAALVLAGVAGLFYYLGVVLTHTRPNWFVGIRTPWTLSSETVWERTHALGGTLFKLTAVLTLVGLPFGEYAVYVLVVSALVTAAVTVTYSYYLYERLEGEFGE